MRRGACGAWRCAAGPGSRAAPAAAPASTATCSTRRSGSTPAEISLLAVLMLRGAADPGRAEAAQRAPAPLRRPRRGPGDARAADRARAGRPPAAPARAEGGALRAAAGRGRAPPPPPVAPPPSRRSRRAADEEPALPPPGDRLNRLEAELAELRRAGRGAARGPRRVAPTSPASRNDQYRPRVPLTDRTSPASRAVVKVPFRQVGCCCGNRRARAPAICLDCGTAA